jgi:hypothetical protein
MIAYWMKKQGFEGFQNPANPTMVAPTAQPAPVPQPAMPVPQPPMPMPQPPMGAGMPPPVPQPQMVGMKPNQQQLMDIATKVQKMSSEQSAISAQLQQITQSFGNEGFQSYQNPYNAASPGDTQTMEFRLGKKSLVDNVIRY